MECVCACVRVCVCARLRKSTSLTRTASSIENKKHQISPHRNLCNTCDLVIDLVQLVDHRDTDSKRFHTKQIEMFKTATAINQ